jgi:hypothetical protein
MAMRTFYFDDSGECGWVEVIEGAKDKSQEILLRLEKAKIEQDDVWQEFNNRINDHSEEEVYDILWDYRIETDRISEVIRQLNKLYKIHVGETNRLYKKYEQARKTLLDASMPGFYCTDALKYFASEGVVCLGHCVTIEDECGDMFDYNLDELDKPLSAALHQQRVGQTVTVKVKDHGVEYQSMYKIFRVEVM